MDFDLTPEQQQLADTVHRWAEKDYGFDARKKMIHAGSGSAEASWQALAELGVLALPVPEAQGGFDGSALDMMVVMQELGRALVVEPVFATALGVEFLKLSGQHPTLLEQVAAGELKLACALGEQQSRYDLFDIATTAVVSGDGFVIDGTKSVVLHGAQAGCLIVSARTAGAQRDTDGISLFAVPADRAGITYRDYRTNDGMRAAHIALKNVTVPASALLGSAGHGWALLDAATDYGIALLCAEALGAMEALSAATLDYLKTRQQFGAPLGKFQALQHRMAEMFMQLEQARSMATLAAVKVGSADPVERRRTVSAAKARIGQALKIVAQEAVQLHGGMGVTDELPVAHYFKRLSMIELTLGDTDHHLARFAAQPGFRHAA